MTLDEFDLVLKSVMPGKAAHVPYEMFSDLFPPGVEDDGAKGRAYQFAKARGFVIDNRQHEREVLFVRAD